MNEYNNLMDALTILERARVNLTHNIGGPAWKMLFHAGLYLEQQAELAMRGEVSR